MQQSNAWRHELKYGITFADYLALRARLRTVMHPDTHAGPDGRYRIRSLYFDDYRDTALREKLDGVQSREKFRVRWYNDDLTVIHLECKTKHNSLCLKRSASLSEPELRALCAGDTAWMRGHPDPLVQELRRKMDARLLRPRVVVSYLREPYVYAPGNVRVTFDSHIRTSLFTRDFLDAADIEAAPGERLMEVKYDDFLPCVIAQLLQTDAARVQAFSKYAVCRRFG